MPTLRAAGWFVALVLTAAAAQSLAAPSNPDLARCMPADTALYIGWTPWLEDGSPELRIQRQYIDAALKLAAAEGEAQLMPPFKLVVEALTTLETAAGGVGVFDVTVENEQVDVQAALVVTGGDRPAKLAGMLRDAAATAGVSTESRTVQGVAFDSLTVPDSPLKLLWTQHKDHVVLALGEAAAAKVIDCLDGKSETLADNAELKFDRQKVDARLSDQYFCVYADIARIITRGKAVATAVAGPLPPIVDQIIDELGFGALRSKYVHINRVDKQPRMRGFAHVDGPVRGLLKIWDQQPLTDDDLKIVPQNAYWASVANLDLAALWTEVMRVMEELAPDAVPTVQGGLAATTPIVGFSIMDELIPNFGDTWAFFDAPDHGGVLLTGTVLVADVKDPEKLQGMLARVVQMLTPFAEAQKAGLTLKQTQHGDHTIHYVLIAGQPVPVAPAWGFVGHRWVLGFWPQSVAAALKQVDPQTRGPSILDHPAVTAARPTLPPNAQGFGYCDMQYLTRLFYPLVNALSTAGSSMFAEYGIEIDMTMLPPVAESVAGVTNYVGTSSRDADGIMYASVGSGAPLLMAGCGAGLGTSILLPSLARARYVSKEAVSAVNLRGIGQGCMVYANDHDDQLPDSLEQLLTDGTITSKMLTSPLDEEGTQSYHYVARGVKLGAVKRPAQFVLAYESPREEQVNVLYADGHVARVQFAAFKTELQETYRQMGREKDLPPEYRD